MSQIHLLIQRWFVDGEGWAYDSDFPSTIRMQAVSQISQLASMYRGELIEQEVGIGKYTLYIRIEPDTNCLDPKAVNRHPHIDIGILYTGELKDVQKIQFRQLALQRTQRGEFSLAELGLATPQKTSGQKGSKFSLLLFSLIFIVIVLLFPAYKIFLAPVPENPVVDNIPQDENSPIDNEGLENHTDGIESVDKKEHSDSPLQPTDETAVTEQTEVTSNTSDNTKSENKQTGDEVVISTSTPKAPETVVPEPTVIKKAINQWSTIHEADILSDWKLRLFTDADSDYQTFRDAEKIQTLIKALNYSHDLRERIPEQAGGTQFSPEIRFLKECFPRNKIDYDDKDITEEEYHKLIQTICDELKVSSFDEIESRLNFMEYFGKFTPKDKVPYAKESEDIHKFILCFCPLEVNSGLQRVSGKILDYKYSEMEIFTPKDTEIMPWYVLWYFSEQHLNHSFKPNWIIKNNPTEEQLVEYFKQEGQAKQYRFSSDKFEDILNEYFNIEEIFNRKKDHPITPVTP